jgi:hypothetical protein
MQTPGPDITSAIQNDSGSEEEGNSSSDGEEGATASGMSPLSRRPRALLQAAAGLQDARETETAVREIHQAGELANRKHYWKDTIKTALDLIAQRRGREQLQIEEVQDEGQSDLGEGQRGWEAEEHTLADQLRRLGEAVDEWRCLSVGRPHLEPEMDLDSRNPGQEIASLGLQATQEMGRLLEGIRLQFRDPRRGLMEESSGPRRVEEVRILINRVQQVKEQGQGGGPEDPRGGKNLGDRGPSMQHPE